MVRFLAIGGGGGGGASAASGGGGGGSAGITSLLIPAMFVPDTILVQVGAGGAGGAQTGTTSNGSNGNDTILSTFFTSSNVVQLLIAQNGVGASGATGGTGGTVESLNYFSVAGIAQSVAGQAGANGNNNLVATSTIPLMGGAGGRPNGSTRSATPNYGYPEADAGSSTKAANGYFQLSPILLGCGGGGGGDNTGSVTNGGIGGDGGIGCGGGGGGSNGTTGFAGGKGGNGAVFIWAW